MLLPEAYLLTMTAAWLVRHRVTLVMSRRSLNRYQARLPGVGAFERLLHRRLRVALANSAAICRELVDEEGIPPERVVLIPNGIDPTRFRSRAPREKSRRELSIPDGDLVLCTVANLIPYKGHGDLLRGLAAVRGELPPWRLLCVGAGDAAPLRRLADDLGIGRNVFWLGPRGDVPDVLAACDIGILASHEEGFSNALLEKMACALPLVATRVGGNRDLVHQWLN